MKPAQNTPGAITSEVRMSSGEVKAVDGKALWSHSWTPADEAAVKAHLLILHGYAEHGERYREFGHNLAARGIACFAIDFRGHGRALGARGHVGDFDEFHRDVDCGLELLPPDVTPFVLAHSHGGLVALHYTNSHHPSWAGLILSNPYLALSTPAPKAKLLAGRIAARIAPSVGLPSGLDARGISHDPDIVERYKRDPMVFTTATGGWHQQATAAQERVKQMTSVPMPLLYVYSDSDPIASPDANRTLASKLESPDKTIELRKGELHEVLNEVNREELHGSIADWILERS